MSLKYEYKVITVPSDEFSEKINEMGQQGWRVVSYRRFTEEECNDDNYWYEEQYVEILVEHERFYND